MHRFTRAHRLAAALVVAAAAIVPFAAPTAAASTTDRAFACSGNAGDIYSQYTVTGSLKSGGRPYAVTITQTATATTLLRTTAATSLGASTLHAGYTTWDITAANPNGDTYALHAPAVLPGAGGYFDADLEVLWAGGAAGGLQVPFFDCTVKGGPASLASPSGTRTFSCRGSLGLARTDRTVTGTLNSRNVPASVKVVETATGTVASTRTKPAKLGASTLHVGYTDWNVTGSNAAGNAYALHIPPVLPAAGGYFDGLLEITFAAGGAWQIPMFDCTVR